MYVCNTELSGNQIWHKDSDLLEICCRYKTDHRVVFSLSLKAFYFLLSFILYLLLRIFWTAYWLFPIPFLVCIIITTMQIEPRLYTLIRNRFPSTYMHIFKSFGFESRRWRRRRGGGETFSDKLFEVNSWFDSQPHNPLPYLLYLSFKFLYNM